MNAATLVSCFFTPAPLHRQAAIAVDSITTTTTVAASFANTVASGSLVCGIVTWDNSAGAAISTITDDIGNAYTVVDTSVDPTFFQAAASFYRANLTNAPKTVTVTFSIGAGYTRVLIDEFTKLAASSPVDVHTSTVYTGAATTTDAVSSGSATTTVAGDLVYGAVAATSSANSYKAGTGFALGLSALGTDQIAMASAHKVLGTATSTAATFTQTSAGRDDVFVIAFKAYTAAKTLAASCTATTTITAAIVETKLLAATCTATTSNTAAIGKAKFFAASVSVSATTTSKISRTRAIPAASTDTITITSTMARALHYAAACTDSVVFTASLLKTKFLAALLTVTTSNTAAIKRNRGFAGAVLDYASLTASLNRRLAYRANEANSVAASGALLVKFPFVREPPATTTWTPIASSFTTWTTATRASSVWAKQSP